MNCYYHPGCEVVGMCVSCGKPICVECKVVLADKIYCNPCADKLFTPPAIPITQAKEKTAYSKGLRIASGIFGVLLLSGVATGLSYFIETGIVAELIVDIVNIVIGVLLLLVSFAPAWVSAKTGIKLEKSSVFGLIFAILVIVAFIAVGLGPEPPGGWWKYSWG